MANLPGVRLEDRVRPFTNTGLDYFGPITVAIGRRREKRWVALFTCLSIRGIHLEIVSSLSTDAAIQAIRRFAARRGNPRKIYCDNATCFHGAERELREALAELNQDEIIREMTKRGIEWAFIPPGAPHMGGAWERLVRSVKTSLKTVLKERVPKEETLHTFLTEIEKVLNDRPLTEISSDPDDENCLTPNHLLLGEETTSDRLGLFDDRDLCLSKQWRISQRLADMFWKRWVAEYLPTLTRRTKWQKNEKSVSVDSLVLVVDGNLPRGLWLRGRVIKTYPGEDGVIRVAEVKTNLGVLKRPVVKLCVLKLNSDT
jgi:hypothetical protein